MEKTQTALGTSLLKNLVHLRERKGELLIEDVGAILEGMASSLESKSAEDSFLKTEIEKMAGYIVDARQHIDSMVPGEDTALDNMKLASAELSEVVRHTEEATTAIMDAADIIQTVASEGGNAEASEKLTNAVMSIYDACNFQDITGQRIQKVMKVLDNIEARVVRLVMLFGGELPDGYEAPPEVKVDERTDAHLMSGPQAGTDVPTQDEIDALFDSL